MTEVPYPTDYDRMVDNIRSELLAQRAMRDLPLDDSQVDALANAIAANLDYGFSVSWAPRWVEPGDPHRWTEPMTADQRQHFVECLQCRRITVHPSEADANAWYERHREAEHR